MGEGIDIRRLGSTAENEIYVTEEEYKAGGGELLIAFDLSLSSHYLEQSAIQDSCQGFRLTGRLQQTSGGACGAGGHWRAVQLVQEHGHAEQRD